VRSGELKKKAVARSSPSPLAPASADNPAGVSFPIVGIGASAGGLAAFEAFFAGMPADKDPGMAFVLVQHLSPDHKSMLSELICRYTRMPVFEVEDGMPVKVNCAYIIPPNYDMAFLNGSLHLLEPVVPRGQRLPIDFFFQSLADDQREHAVGIVLSGTGSDGTLGVRAIKAAGGMVMAQNIESCEFDGMPRSAIATGLVDYQLPPAEMPAQLMAYAAHALGKLPCSSVPTTPRVESALKKIFILLAHRDRSRLFAIQIRHHLPPHRAAHGGAPDRSHRHLCQLPAANAHRGGCAVWRPLNWRDQLLSRPRGFSGA
jgi:two-component system CheB/CheR fusion protein